MECIKYINDLEIKIETLERLKGYVDDEEKLNKQINEKKMLLNECKNNLRKLSDNEVCYKLYVYMLDGLSPTKAIEKVAEEYYYSEPTVWRYYRTLKKMLK